MEAQGMIERVATAILAEAQNMGGLAFTFPIEKRLAIAALRAMREPTSAMMDAGDGCCGEYGCGDYRMKQIFSAMIDAALNDQERT